MHHRGLARWRAAWLAAGRGRKAGTRRAGGSQGLSLQGTVGRRRDWRQAGRQAGTRAWFKARGMELPRAPPPQHAQQQARPPEPPRQLGGAKAVCVIVVFSLHNAWNCWVFLNFTNFGPAEELLGVGDAEIAFITTIGWIGILTSVPVVTVCTWHRTLLFAAGLMNVGPPALRYFAAVQGNYELVVLSNFLQGTAFGVLGAWPAMLAALQWPQEQRTLVTAVASLSNYVGGAAGVTFMPAMADTAPKLLEIFKIQSYVAGLLFILMVTWFWIPPIRVADDSRSDLGEEGGLTLRQELEVCLRGKAGQQVLTFGLLIGMSLLLQGMNQFVLAGVGFDDVSAGEGNTLYQLAAAVVGVGVGSRCESEADLQKVLHVLHIAMAVGIVIFGSLCAVAVNTSDGSGLLFPGAVGVMLLVMTLLGGTLMGMLPFCLQQACYTVAPASENVVSGLIYLVAMLVAASITQVASTIAPIWSVALITCLVVLEVYSTHHHCRHHLRIAFGLDGLCGAMCCSVWVLLQSATTLR